MSGRFGVALDPATGDVLFDGPDPPASVTIWLDPKLGERHEWKDGRVSHWIQHGAERVNVLLDPQPITDTFCSCPHCRCLGHHVTEVQIYEEWVRVYPDGTPTDPVNPRPGSPTRIDRVCTFCARKWSRHTTPAFVNGAWVTASTE